MTPLRPTNFRLDEDMLAELQRIKERDGIPVTEQVRRALAAWIAAKNGKKSKKK
jgi:hypothetical protein